MIGYSFDEMVHRTLAVGVLTRNQIDSIWNEMNKNQPVAEQFLQIALRKGWLTSYQIDRLVSGDDFGFFFGPYKALYMAGAGTFARVFRAVRKETESVAAVKVLRARFSDNSAFIGHFLNEGKLVSELKHPNIVPVFDVASSGRLHYMAMEFVEGQTLREFLKIRKKIDAKTVVQIGIDACSALDYALRQKKLPHRDLKLSNVILSSAGQAKLVDFGLASIAQKKEGQEVLFLKNQQSVDYIALEKAAGAPRMDDRSDLYFLGTILYQLICGVSPFEETKNKAKRMDRSRYLNVRAVQNVDPEIPSVAAALINRAMTVHPDQRYQSPMEMLADLKSAKVRLEEADGETLVSSLRIGMNTDREKRIKNLDRKTVMLVDNNEQTRQSMETLLERLQYNALAVNDPQKVPAIFADNDTAAQCIVFNAQTLGIRAVRAFNDFAQYRGLRDIGAILILDGGQADWADDVTPQHNRVVLTMPVKVKELRDAMKWLTDGLGSN
ncbi:MAG: serine/threonine protein kinase [Planctomycetaceae bacterium]|jgi:serine/threonine-protein kinase|nr:serine/threonine protein kinase [Planctomycetaceae bacterium]